MRIPTIGLEIHTELKTGEKMFCSCLNDPNEVKPNVNVCPICLGHPGTLPTINREAVEAVLKLGLALSGKIAKNSHFDRKSYFYPDLPKAYQISQHEHPLIEGGMLRNIRIHRIHLEEDAGRLLHELPGSKKTNATHVDFNRAGVPLMELVTEPDIKSAEEAVQFARELRLMMRYLGISDADMEKGQMRVEANISLDMGTKVEVKNINSFRAVHDAIVYELERQKKLLEEGGKVIHETRGWNESKKQTVSQRTKEEAHDYRYFPEPDLPPLEFEDADILRASAGVPELPEAKRHRFVAEFGFNIEDVEVLIENREYADFFEAAASELKALVPGTDYRLLYNYFTSDLRGLMNEKNVSVGEIKITPEHFAHLTAMVERGELSSRLAKDILLKMFETGEDPEILKKQEKLEFISNEDELKVLAEEIIGKNPKAAEDYRKGKEEVIQFLVGQVMAKTRGQADPEVLREIFGRLLN